MIWQSEHAAQSGRGALAARVLEEIRAACGNGDLADTPGVWEAAAGVAAYLDEQPQPAEVDPRRLLGLASRALHASGQNGLARRLLALGSGMVRPAAWLVAGEDTVWVLDLRRLTLLPTDRLELVFFQRIHLILDAIADVWDPAGGDGMLGLRHTRPAALALLGRSADRRAVARLAAEIRRACAGRLDTLRVRRGWATAPFVMNLDT